MAAQEGAFTGAAGLRIAYRRWPLPTPRAPRAVAVVVHTAFDHSARYDEFAANLVHRGIEVWALDQRGHGQSDGSPNMIERLSYATGDLGQLVELVRAEWSSPVFLVGHSVGATVGLTYALDHQDLLTGVVTTGASIDTSGAPGPLRLAGDLFHLDRVAAAVSPRFPLLSFRPEDVTSDASEARAWVEDPLIHHGRLPMRTVSELATAIRGPLSKRLGEFHLPLLALHGADDRIISSAASLALGAGVSSEDQTVSVLESLRHDLFHEVQPARRAVHDQIGDWIESRATTG